MWSCPNSREGVEWDDTFEDPPMRPENRRFTSEEVSSIVRRGLHSGTGEDVSYADLEEIARQSGISPSRLRRAIQDEEHEGRLDAARETWKRRRKQQFFHHLRAYCIVNGILFLMNLASSPGEFWVIWPMLGWGIGLAFDASDAFFPNESKIDRAARKMLRRQERQAEAVYD